MILKRKYSNKVKKKRKKLTAICMEENFFPIATSIVSDTWVCGQQHSLCLQMHQMFLPNNLKCHLNMPCTFLFTDCVDREQHNLSGL